MIDKIVLELIEQREAASKAGDWPTFKAIDKAINERGWALANGRVQLKSETA